MKSIKYLLLLMTSLVFVNVFSGQKQAQNSRLMIGDIENKTPWVLRLVDKLNEDTQGVLQPNEKQELYCKVGDSKDVQKDSITFKEEFRFRVEARDLRSDFLIGSVFFNMALFSERPE